MGTSTMGSDLHSDKQDKLLKLQARKKELEQMLANKNEELYKLCVQEVQLTGVMPPEAPLSPDAPRERLGSARGAERDGADVQDGADCASRRPRAAQTLCHRLSTPSVAGAAARSAPARPRRPDTSCSNFFPSPPQERYPDTFAMHPSHTYPRLSPAPDEPPRARALPELHYRAGGERLPFSSSQPDIAARPAPLLYQYAAQLKAQSQHLGALAPARRRPALQRTQTYHLTSHSEYAHHLEPRPPTQLQLQVNTEECAGYSPNNFDWVSVSKFSPLSPDARAKEKQWYETSLDAPARSETALRKSASLKRSPSSGTSQPYEIMISSGRRSALHSPGALSPPAAPDSPSNMTVIQQGKCIPYREETKPFEMSDFYKYSTKFRQASAARPAPPARAPQPPPFSPQQWHGYAN